MGVPLTINLPQEYARDQYLGKLESGEYQTESVACFCGSRISDVVSEWDRYQTPCTTRLCLNCGIIYVSPRLTEKSSREFYKREYRDLYQTKLDHADVPMTEDEDFKSSITNGTVLKEICTNYDLHPQVVVDIGCNSGGMLKPFQDIGCTVYA